MLNSSWFFVLRFVVLAMGFLFFALAPLPARAHGAALEAHVAFRPTPPVAGEPLTFEVALVYADDSDPIGDARVFVSAEGPDGATIGAVQLEPTEDGELWAGTVVLPEAGVWTMAISVHLPAGVTSDRYNVQVAPAGTPAGAETGHFVLELSLPQAAAQPAWTRYWPLAAGTLIVVVLVVTFWLIPGDRTEEAPAQ